VEGPGIRKSPQKLLKVGSKKIFNYDKVEKDK
jgi:hypothetical protein